MSSHDHHNNDSNEPKAVSFTVPFILASVTLIIIFITLSFCDPKKHETCECKDNCTQECMEACEKGDHSKHSHSSLKEQELNSKIDHVESEDTMAVETPAPTVDDTLKKTEAAAH